MTIAIAIALVIAAVSGGIAHLKRQRDDARAERDHALAALAGADRTIASLRNDLNATGKRLLEIREAFRSAAGRDPEAAADALAGTLDRLRTKP